MRVRLGWIANRCRQFIGVDRRPIRAAIIWCGPRVLRRRLPTRSASEFTTWSRAARYTIWRRLREHLSESFAEVRLRTVLLTLFAATALVARVRRVLWNHDLSSYHAAARDRAAHGAGRATRPGGLTLCRPRLGCHRHWRGCRPGAGRLDGTVHFRNVVRRPCKRRDGAFRRGGRDVFGRAGSVGDSGHPGNARGSDANIERGIGPGTYIHGSG